MPIAKTAETIREVAVKQTPASEPLPINEEVIHPEFYRFFNVNPVGDDQSSLLKTISKWALGEEDKSVGNALRKIRSLETKLGVPNAGETRLSKIYNYIRISSQVSSIKDELRQSVKEAQTKHSEVINKLRETHKEKLNKITEDLKRAESDYRRAVKAHRLQASNYTNNIKKRFENQIAELKKMRSAYGGEK